MESVGLSPVESVGLSPVESVGLSPVESTGKVWLESTDSAGLCHILADSTGLHWTPPGLKYANLALVTLTKSGS